MRIFRFLTASSAALLLVSCGSPTIPTAAEMDRYYVKAEELAENKISALEAKRDHGEMTPMEFTTQASLIRGHIGDQATELAWARHENIEAQKRGLGIPTGDHPVKVQVPGAGAGESFYRRAGQSAGTGQYNTAPYGGSVLGGPNRGDRPSIPPVQPPGGPAGAAAAEPDPADEPKPIDDPQPLPKPVDEPQPKAP
jgi:hypothetical protein